MNIKAIVFDLDGTLIDSMGLWREVDTQFLNSRGIEVPEDLFDHLSSGNSFIQTAEYFKKRFDLSESCEEIMQIWTDMVVKYYESKIPLKDGVDELLRRLKAAGLKLGLATSNSYELAQKSLTNHGLWHLFEYAATGDQDILGKPHPDIFLACAAGLDLQPRDCLAIEDTLHGVRAAKAAGMHTLAIYDKDSAKDHAKMKKLADAFCMDYLCIKHEIKKLREDI